MYVSHMVRCAKRESRCVWTLIEVESHGAEVFRVSRVLNCLMNARVRSEPLTLSALKTILFFFGL